MVIIWFARTHILISNSLGIIIGCNEFEGIRLLVIIRGFAGTHTILSSNIEITANIAN